MGNDSLVASNESLLILLRSIPPKEFKQGFIQMIRDKGLTFRQRDLVEEVCQSCVKKMFGTRH